MKNILFCCLVLMACTAPDNHHFSKAEKDSMVWRFNRKMNNYLVTANDDSAKTLLANMSDTVAAVDYNRLSLYWTIMRAQVVSRTQDYDSLRVLLDSAMILSKEADIAQKDVLNFYIMLNGQLLLMGKTDSALLVATEANILAKKIDTKKLAQTNSDLATVYKEIGDLPNFGKYALEANKHVESAPHLKAVVALQLFEYYFQVDQLDSALYYQNNYLADSFWTLRPLQRAHEMEYRATFLLENEKIKEGLEMLLRATAVFDSLGLKYAFTYLNLAEAYGALKQYKSAFSFLDSARSLAVQENDRYLERMSWQIAADIYKKEHDYKRATDAMDSTLAKYLVETDSSLANYGRELEAKYAGREKDLQIASLATTNQISQKIQRQQRLIIIVMIVAVVAIAFSAVLIRRRSKLEQQLREAYLQQKVLQSQMQPHFVTNILSVLKGYIRSGDQERSIAFLSQFGRVTEQNLYNAQAHMITLGEELTAINNYLALQVMQLGLVFRYEIIRGADLEEDDIYIPPMLVQPFVENAVIHGMSGLKYQGTIRIFVELQGPLLKFVVDDDGRGLPPSRNVAPNRLHATEIATQRLNLVRRS